MQLNQLMRRNLSRFPADFAFQLTTKEFAALRSQIVTSKARGGRRYLPWVFTEHGAIMLASVLNSPVAIEASVRVVRAFVYLREQIAANQALAKKFAELEERLDSHDESIATLFEAIRQLLEPPEAEHTRREIRCSIKAQTRPCSLHRGMGYARVPLTPSLSQRERENHPLSLGQTRDRVCQGGIRRTHAYRMRFPLPEGEGQGEGKCRLVSHRVWPVQGAPQYVFRRQSTR